MSAFDLATCIKSDMIAMNAAAALAYRDMPKPIEPQPDCDLCHEPAAECECPSEYNREHDSHDLER